LKPSCRRSKFGGAASTRLIRRLRRSRLSRQPAPPSAWWVLRSPVGEFGARHSVWAYCRAWSRSSCCVSSTTCRPFRGEASSEAGGAPGPTRHISGPCHIKDPQRLATALEKDSPRKKLLAAARQKAATATAAERADANRVLVNLLVHELNDLAEGPSL